jgi:hypothetical protein
MSQTTHSDLGGENDSGVCYLSLLPDLSDSELTIAYEIDGDQTQSAPNQPPQGDSSFGDSSGPLFTIYSKAAEEEDNKMVERWQKDADGILIFVSLCVSIHTALGINWDTIDWSILCCCRCTPCCDRPRP